MAPNQRMAPKPTIGATWRQKPTIGATRKNPLSIKGHVRFSTPTCTVRIVNAISCTVERDDDDDEGDKDASVHSDDD